MIGSVSSSFFPMNIVILPFIPVITSVRNRNTNETFNKMQYSFLVLLYSEMLLIFQLVLAPIMMVKLILNTLHLMFNLQGQTFYNQYIRPFWILIASPFIIIISIIVDFLTLPKIFWKNEE